MLFCFLAGQVALFNPTRVSSPAACGAQTARQQSACAQWHPTVTDIIHQPLSMVKSAYETKTMAHLAWGGNQRGLSVPGFSQSRFFPGLAVPQTGTVVLGAAGAGLLLFWRFAARLALAGTAQST